MKKKRGVLKIRSVNDDGLQQLVRPHFKMQKGRAKRKRITNAQRAAQKESRRRNR